MFIGRTTSSHIRLSHDPNPDGISSDLALDIRPLSPLWSDVVIRHFLAATQCFLWPTVFMLVVFSTDKVSVFVFSGCRLVDGDKFTVTCVTSAHHVQAGWTSFCCIPNHHLYLLSLSAFLVSLLSCLFHTFFSFFLIRGGTHSLRMPALRPASQAVPMRNTRKRTSVVLRDTITLT